MENNIDFSDICNVKNIEEMINEIVREHDKKVGEGRPSIMSEEMEVTEIEKK